MNFPQQFSKLTLGAAIRKVLHALFLVILGAGATLAQTLAYVTNRDDKTVSVIDTVTNTVIATVPVGTTPEGVAITPTGAFAYVVNGTSTSGTGEVSVINTTTNTVVTTIPVGVNALGIAITPNGARAYVTNARENNVSVIDTATNTVIATVPVDHFRQQSP